MMKKGLSMIKEKLLVITNLPDFSPLKGHTYVVKSKKYLAGVPVYKLENGEGEPLVAMWDGNVLVADPENIQNES